MFLDTRRQPLYLDPFDALFRREVCVYKNLNNGLWSVTEVKGFDNRGTLICYADQLVLTKCRAVTKESRRLAIVERGQREVCAWFIGQIDPVAGEPAVRPAVGPRVTFHPYERPDFFEANTGATVDRADELLFAAGGHLYLAA